MNIATIGLDLAKHWFQVHGVDHRGQVVVRRKLRRSEAIPYFRSLSPCLVGMEACATAHHWARELAVLGYGRSIRRACLRSRQFSEQLCRSHDRGAAGRGGGQTGGGVVHR